MSGPLGWTAAEWATAVRSGALDPREGLEFALRRARELDRGLNALLGLEEDWARARAEELAAALARGDDPGPLAGVPVAVKDNIAVEGWPLSCGSRILAGFRSRFTATVVTRLCAAGALPFARANLDEFAMGASTENSAFGPARNPHDPERVPGGSSGGSAVAVAAGYCPLALGSETGGSVRQPAAFCGLFGMKPTYGRFSRYGLVAFASSLDQIGVFGRSAEDLARAFDAAAGPDPRDATSLADAPEAATGALNEGVSGLRVGLLRNSFADGVDREIQERVRAAAEGLEAGGARVEEVHLPHEEAIVPAYYLINTAEASANLARFDGVRYGHRAAEADTLEELYLRSRDEGFGPEVKRRILLGTFSLSAGYHDQYFQAAQQARTLLVRAYTELLSRYTLLLGPTTPTPAFPLGSKVDDPVAMYLCDVFTAAANLTGLPAVNVPAGRNAESLPLGVQLTAAHRAEPTLLRAARVLEGALGGALAVPGAASASRPGGVE